MLLRFALSAYSPQTQSIHCTRMAVSISDRPEVPEKVVANGFAHESPFEEEPSQRAVQVWLELENLH